MTGWARGSAAVLVSWGCSGAIPPARALAVDRDGDGYAVANGDCDDDDPEISPQGLDLPGDGVDSDCDGDDAAALPAAALAPYDLLITEVMADPVGVPADLGEWFEIANTLPVDVDLEGVRFADDLGDAFVVARSVVIGAGARLVLGGTDDEIENGGVPVDFRLPAGFGLSNREDQIHMSTTTGPIHSVAWDADWPRRDGYALSLSSDADPSIEGSDPWCLADEEDVYGTGGRGTPGEANPACPPPFEGLTIAALRPGDLVLTEVMQNPLATDDDFGEWIEIYVAAEAPVDLAGLVIENDEGDAFELGPGAVADPGAYVVIGAFADRKDNGGAPVDVEWRWGFGLANSGDTVRLLAGTRTIDAIAYDNGATFPDPEGASMSLDPGAVDADANDDGARWCPGVDPYGAGDLGSPGAANPPCPPS